MRELLLKKPSKEIVKHKNLKRSFNNGSLDSASKMLVGVLLRYPKANLTNWSLSSLFYV